MKWMNQRMGRAWILKAWEHRTFLWLASGSLHKPLLMPTRFFGELLLLLFFCCLNECQLHGTHSFEARSSPSWAMYFGVRSFLKTYSSAKSWGSLDWLTPESRNRSYSLWTFFVFHVVPSGYFAFALLRYSSRGTTSRFVAITTALLCEAAAGFIGEEGILKSRVHGVNII